MYWGLGRKELVFEMADDEEEAELYGVGVGNDTKNGELSNEAIDTSLDDGLGEKEDDEAGNDNGDDDDGCGQMNRVLCSNRESPDIYLMAAWMLSLIKKSFTPPLNLNGKWYL